MATVKEILNERKCKEQEEAERAREIAEQEAAYEGKKLMEAAKVIKEALAGFKYEHGGSVFGNHFKVKISRREIFVVYKFETRQIRYSDESPLEDVRRLVINIGFTINTPSLITCVDYFAESFVDFLRRERLA